MANWDIFFSYRRHDLHRAQPLLDALARIGVRVWRDADEIPDQGSITSEIRRAIANSRAFLAFYSRTYSASNPCQQELTSAWLAAQQIDKLSNRRVWILNPEDSLDHIPLLLRDQQFAAAGDGAPFHTIAHGLKDRLDALDKTLFGDFMRDLPAYFGMSPIQARRFVGRTMELWHLHGQLTANRISIISGVYGQPATQVRGLGGNGKSLLAREYSIRFGPDYPGGVFWMNAYGYDDAKGSVTPEQRQALRRDQIREFATQLGVPTEGATPEEIEARLWRTMESRGERCLWIVDDLPSGLPLRDIETTWCPHWVGASALVTTRSGEYGALGAVFDLGVLSPLEAFGLLYSHRQPVDGAEETAAHRIVELLGNHPLALDVAGSYLALGIEGFEDYLTALINPEEDAVEFGDLIQEALPTGHERSISATLLKSIRHLGAEGLDFLRLASVLATAPIEVKFVAEVFERLNSTGKGRKRAAQSLNQAALLSLCEAVQGTRQVHTLVSRTMRFHFPSDERTVALRSAAQQVITTWLIRANQAAEYSKIAASIIHARRLIANDLETEEDTELARLVAYHDSQRGDYNSARKLEEQVLEVRRTRLGGHHPATLTAMSSLALTLCNQGHLAEARNIQEELVKVCGSVLGEEQMETLAAMHNLGWTLYRQGDLTAARKLQERVLLIRRRSAGEEHLDTLRTMHNLALTLKDQGDLEGARKLEEYVLAGRLRLLGENHLDTLTGMENLVLTLEQQGDLTSARSLQENLLDKTRRLLGEWDPHSLRAMHNLGLTLHRQRDLEGALKLQEHVLAGRRRLFGEENPQTLKAMNALAQTLHTQGDSTEERKVEEQALRISRLLFGQEHMETVTAMNNFAQTLYSLGDFSEARKLQEQVLDQLRRLLGDQHPTSLKAAYNLARTLYAQGDAAGSAELQKLVLAGSRRLLGNHHLETLRIMDTLALALRAQGDLAAARELHQKVVIGYRRLLGDQHPETQRALASLSNVTSEYRSLGLVQRLRRLIPWRTSS